MKDDRRKDHRQHLHMKMRGRVDSRRFEFASRTFAILRTQVEETEETTLLVSFYCRFSAGKSNRSGHRNIYAVSRHDTEAVVVDIHKLSAKKAARLEIWREPCHVTDRLKRIVLKCPQRLT